MKGVCILTRILFYQCRHFRSSNPWSPNRSRSGFVAARNHMYTAIWGMAGLNGKLRWLIAGAIWKTCWWFRHPGNSPVEGKVVYPIISIISRDLYIPGRVGFLASTVWLGEVGGSKSKFLTFLNTKTALKTESKFYQAGFFFRKKCNCIQLLVNGMEYLYRTICHILPLLVHTWSIYGIFILLNTHRILPQISTTTRVKF